MDILAGVFRFLRLCGRTFAALLRCPKALRFWYAREIEYNDLQPEDRCANHPRFPDIGPHERIPTFRASVVTGAQGLIGSTCNRCPAQRLGTPFMEQQMQFLALRGQKDRTADWIQGRWIPEVVASLPPDQREVRRSA